MMAPCFRSQPRSVAARAFGGAAGKGSAAGPDPCSHTSLTAGVRRLVRRIGKQNDVLLPRICVVHAGGMSKRHAGVYSIPSNESAGRCCAPSFTGSIVFVDFVVPVQRQPGIGLGAHYPLPEHPVELLDRNPVGL
jgi:hypothetical protein